MHTAAAMLLPENYPVNPDDLVFMELAPFEAPIFSTSVPQFANSNRVREHKVVSIDVTPVLYERRTPEWYDGAVDEDPVHEILMFFDPDEYPVADYGLIWRDMSFEIAAVRHLAKVFPRAHFGEPEYTSLAEQGDDFVSLRYPIGGSRGFSRTLRKNVDLFASFARNSTVKATRLINPMSAERYRQALAPHDQSPIRPTPPEGLYAGMWITWSPPR